MNYKYYSTQQGAAHLGQPPMPQDDDKEVVRIISARKAVRHERMLYDNRKF